MKPWIKWTIILQSIFIILCTPLIYLNTFYPFYIIVSQSMSPTIKKDDVVFIIHRPETYDFNLVGKIVVFFNPLTQQKIAHRIVDFDGKYFTTKGDNNSSADVYRPTKENIFGVVWKVLNFSNRSL